MNAIVPLPTAAPQNRATLARHIAALLLEREASQRAMRAAQAKFDSPPPPAELTVVQRGLLGEVEIDVDADLLRDQIPMCSPRSRRGRSFAGSCGSTMTIGRPSGPTAKPPAWLRPHDQLQRIDDALRNAAKAALAQPRQDAAGVALHAGALLAGQLAGRSDAFARQAVKVIPALLEIAANAIEGSD